MRRQGHALIQLEVLHFTGWLPYRTREEFDEYGAEHPELEPFPPYDFGASKQTSKKDVRDGGGALQGFLLYVTNLGYTCWFLMLSFLCGNGEWRLTPRKSVTITC